MADHERCVHVKDDGERCRVEASLSDAGLCLWHDPERKEKAQAARKRGANTRSKSFRRTAPESDVPGPPSSLQDAVQWASWTTWAVATGNLDKETGRAAIYALRTFVDTVKDAEDLDALRQDVEALKARSGMQEASA